MTRMHFEAIARAVRETVYRCSLNGNQAEMLARLMADTCEEFNPRFDRERFLRACGV